jgi:hypothetical protein
MNPIARLIFIITLAGCAAPNIDRSQATFKQPEYDLALDECRGTTAFTASATSIGLALAGSIFGAANTIAPSFLWGGGWESAALGGILGAVIGFGAGAINSVKDYNDNIDTCLRKKGYVMIPYLN